MPSTKPDLIEPIWKGGITKSEMARRMWTSRSQPNRLVDPDNTKIQLDTLYKAAGAVGRRVRLELMDEPRG